MAKWHTSTEYDDDYYAKWQARGSLSQRYMIKLYSYQTTWLELLLKPICMISKTMYRFYIETQNCTLTDLQVSEWTGLYSFHSVLVNNGERGPSYVRGVLNLRSAIPIRSRPETVCYDQRTGSQYNIKGSRVSNVSDCDFNTAALVK